MACEFEQRVALYVEEDLEVAEQAVTELHLRTCEACAALAEELKESQSLFKTIRQNIPNQAMLSTVRSRVLAEASARRVRWFERFLVNGFGQRATLAGIALLIVGWSGLWLLRAPDAERPASVTPPPVLDPRPVHVDPAPEPALRVAAAKSLVHRHRPTRNVAAEPPKQVAIKFLTDDPNIIIYWLIEEKGD